MLRNTFDLILTRHHTMENLCTNLLSLPIILMCEWLSESSPSYYGYWIAKLLCEVPAEAEETVL
jgi:hypothetical protein